MKKIAVGSNWIMHMDFESMRSSEIGIYLEDTLEKVPAMEEKMRGFQKKFGVDLMGVSNLTIFGSGERHKGIGILEGGVDSSIVTEVTRSREYIQESKLGETPIFSTERGRRPIAFSVLEKGKIVFGPDSDYVYQGIEIANGKGSGSISHPILNSLNGLLDDPGYLLFADVKEAMKVADLDQRVQSMIEKVDAAGVVIGDDADGLKIIGLVQTDSSETSEPMENMIRGGLAMMEMKISNNSSMVKLLNGYRVTRKDRMIRVEIELSTSFIIERIKKEMKKSV